MRTIALAVMLAALLPLPALAATCSQEIQAIAKMLGVEAPDVPGAVGSPTPIGLQPEEDLSPDSLGSVGAPLQIGLGAPPLAEQNVGAMNTSAGGAPDDHAEALNDLQDAENLNTAGDEAGCLAEIAKVKSLLGM